MEYIRFSMVIFYDSDGKILLQDRRNLWKDDIEWWWFWGRSDANETPEETAIREITEELNIVLDAEDLTHIGKLTRECYFSYEIREGNIFAVQWQKKYETTFQVLEGAGYEWVSPDEMRNRRIYDVQFVHLGIFEEYIKTLHA